MYTVTKRFTFEAAHRLLGYVGPCANVHGHSYKVDVSVSWPLLSLLDMAGDFKELDVVKTLLDTWDHALLLNSNDPLVAMLDDEVNVVVFAGKNPTTEVMAAIVAERAAKELLASKRISVDVWETEKCHARFDSEI